MKNKKDYFHLDYRPENFGLLLKGASLDKLPKYHDRFDECIIVSDYDDELEVFGEFLLNKQITHFTNRSFSSSLKRKNYKKYGIENVQLGQVFRWNHYTLIKTFIRYQLMFADLRVTFLPEELLEVNKSFGEEYALKFPNTGILSVIYVLNIIKPKNLWIFGLDFYAREYAVEQIKNPVDENSPLEQRDKKIKRLELVKYTHELLNKKSEETNINLVTYYKDWPNSKNIRVL